MRGKWMKLWGQYRQDGGRLDFATYIQLLKENGDIQPRPDGEKR